MRINFQAYDKKSYDEWLQDVLQQTTVGGGVITIQIIPAYPHSYVSLQTNSASFSFLLKGSGYCCFKICNPSFYRENGEWIKNNETAQVKLGAQHEWEEIKTGYETVTKYRSVENQRTVTRYKDETRYKKVTVVEYLRKS